MEQVRGRIQRTGQPGSPAAPPREFPLETVGSFASAALLKELDRIIDTARFPFSPRIQTLKASVRK